MGGSRVMIPTSIGEPPPSAPACVPASGHEPQRTQIVPRPDASSTAIDSSAIPTRRARALTLALYDWESWIDVRDAAIVFR